MTAFDIAACVARWRAAGAPDAAAYERAFNEMMCVEHSNWLTLARVDEFVAAHPHVRLTDQGMQELVVYSDRFDVADHIIAMGRVSSGAKRLYDDTLDLMLPSDDSLQ